MFAALQTEDVDYVLVGAVALDVWGIGRLTEDIELFVRPTEEDVARLRRALRRVWQDPSIDEITAEDLAGEYPAVQGRRSVAQRAVRLEGLTRCR